ncbi:hypothetical protein NQZ68_037043 [Dissostichus eleginoides]|nr:hypothetical protein NQZ68_037043 [Dissostichus eleginoides]
MLILAKNVHPVIVHPHDVRCGCNNEPQPAVGDPDLRVGRSELRWADRRSRVSSREVSGRRQGLHQKRKESAWRNATYYLAESHGMSSR